MRAFSWLDAGEAESEQDDVPRVLGCWVSLKISFTSSCGRRERERRVRCELPARGRKLHKTRTGDAYILKGRCLGIFVCACHVEAQKGRRKREDGASSREGRSQGKL